MISFAKSRAVGGGGRAVARRAILRGARVRRAQARHGAGDCWRCWPVGRDQPAYGAPDDETRQRNVAVAGRVTASRGDPLFLAVLADADPVHQGRQVIDRLTTLAPASLTDPGELMAAGGAASGADDRRHLLTTGMGEYTRSGVIGRPSLGSADKGKAVLASLVDSFAPVLEILRRDG